MHGSRFAARARARAGSVASSITVLLVGRRLAILWLAPRSETRPGKDGAAMAVPEIVHWVDGKVWDGTSRPFRGHDEPGNAAR